MALFFRATMENILKCYRDKYRGTCIKQSSQSVPVYWGHFSIVEAELLCLKDLLNTGRNWSFVLNMAGSEVMLLTNRELVANLSANMGRIHTNSYPLPQKHYDRITMQWIYNPALNKMSSVTKYEKSPPFNISIYKGPKSWILPKKFTEFLFDQPVAREFIGTLLQVMTIIS